MAYLGLVEQFLFWSGLIVFLVSLAMYAGRTKDFKSLAVFWQPTIEFSKKEFIVNRVGLLMMVVAVMMRVFLYFIG